MYIFRILSLLVLSAGFIQSIDIFKAIESKNIKNVQKILKKVSSVDVYNQHGQTPLIVAVRVGSKSCMQLLLQYGVDINAVDAYGKTALDYAVELKMHHKVRYLAKNGAKVTSEQNLQAVKKVLKRRARMFMGISLGLLGLVALTTLPSLLMITPVHPVCWGCAYPVIILEGVVAGAGIGTLIPGAYWYRQVNKVQIL